MEARAITRYLRVSPHKARLVADMVRGKMVDDALTLLRFTPKKSCRLITKTLRSAIANAENNGDMDVNRLYIHAICIDEGPKLKRWRPRAMGRATRILKGTSHVSLVLKEK